MISGVERFGGFVNSVYYHDGISRLPQPPLWRYEVGFLLALCELDIDIGKTLANSLSKKPGLYEFNVGWRTFYY